MYPPPASRTSNAELLGSLTGIILIVVVAALGLTVMIGMVYWADSHPDNRLGPGRKSRTELGEIPPGQGHRPWERTEDRHVPEHGHPHGKPASWVLVGAVLMAFLVGGASIIVHLWWLTIACGAVIVLAVPVGKGIGIMDDTIAWGSTPAAVEDESPQPEPGQVPDYSGYAETR